MPHKFKIGDRVCGAQVLPPTGKGASEIFAVARLMPEDRAGEPGYRVRTEAGERAMSEGELVAARR
ncbi:hypothetical protein Q8W71_29235 [Methylobacterium sp. NEAU 140]|uniref:hypothetical protein n=1 Tax=Methylobacterium sp. NEAU 140 TaxID=3064945 RepID=UPI00273362A7|nr:hypothetical protein [Methylobacterium sp. NEAU 140]MDP4026695.1 hypothetical protein [Methylobacterium sp. NEAU 140]